MTTNASLVCSSIVRFAGRVNVGWVFTSLTITRKLFVLLAGGEPASVTRTVIQLVLGPSASVGVQVNTPVTGSRTTPAGPDIRLNLRVLAGESASVAVFVTTNCLSSSIT